MPLSRETLGLLLGTVGVVLFGATLPMTRLAVAELDPWFITAGRAALGGVAAALYLAVRRPALPGPGGDGRAVWRDLIIVALCLVIGFPLLMALAMTTLGAAHGGVVLAVLPLATVVAARLVLGERPSRGFWAVAVVGAALVLAFTVWRAGGAPFGPGNLWLAASIVACALGYAVSGRVAGKVGALEVIAVALVLTLPLSLALTVAFWPADAARVPAAAWAAFAYLGLISQFLGFLFWNRGLALGGVARVSQTQLLQTFVTLGLAALLLGETIDAVTLLFAVAVVATVLISRRMPVNRPVNR